jgi:hypothetical protein
MGSNATVIIKHIPNKLLCIIPHCLPESEKILPRDLSWPLPKALR